MGHIAKKMICLLLAAVFLLSAFAGCSENEQEPDSSGGDEATATPKPTPVSVADDKFTLEYDSDKSLNPLNGGSAQNMHISSLIYEGLFVLDKSFEAQPKLCESHHTEDGQTWLFNIPPGIPLHDGSILTADDVVYSIREAKRTMYSLRLRNITSVEAVGELTVRIALSQVNYNLPALLDVPVMKSGTGTDDAPVGTGPYYAYGGTQLRAFLRHREYESLPVHVIYLKDITPTERAREFSARNIDLIIEDPNSASAADIYAGNERYDYNTTVFQYIGFNTANGIFADLRMRKAVSHAVNREYIADEIMSGNAASAPLALPPYLSYYNSDWESGTEYSVRAMSSALAAVGLQDDDGDGYLEIPDGEGGTTAFLIDFIVNDDNEYKIEAAREIAYEIRGVGINIELRILPWDEYKNELESGNFDMYYAEAGLTPDFDLSPLIDEGGALNYGEFSDIAVSKAMSDFLAVEDASARNAAAKQVCVNISIKTPIIPILYRKYCVRSNRGVVTGISPVVSGVFCNIAEWEITF